MGGPPGRFAAALLPVSPFIEFINFGNKTQQPGVQSGAQVCEQVSGHVEEDDDGAVSLVAEAGRGGGGGSSGVARGAQQLSKQYGAHSMGHEGGHNPL